MIPIFEAVGIQGLASSVSTTAALLGGLAIGVVAVLAWLIARSAGEVMRQQAAREWEARGAAAPDVRPRLAA